MAREIPRFVREHYEIHEWRHAIAILATDYPEEWDDIMAALQKFRLHKSEIEIGGGSKTKVAGRIDGALAKLGWRERGFKTKIVVDDLELDSPTHRVDCFKERVGLEVEWNNKDPFFDRDLNNFRLLFELRALSVGVIVTRCDELQTIFDALGRGKSYGNSTTHMGKLLPERGRRGRLPGPCLWDWSQAVCRRLGCDVRPDWSASLHRSSARQRKSCCSLEPAGLPRSWSTHPGVSRIGPGRWPQSIGA